MTPRHLLSKRFALALTAAAVLLAAGCGGGGTGDSPEIIGEAGSPLGAGSLSGSVVKGPVRGATVRAFALNGGTIGGQVASAVTDANGAFTMPMGGYAGPLMLQMSGGTYTDEATGVPMVMAPGDMMTAVLPAFAAGAAVNGVAVTPLTAMAQAMAQRMPGGLTDANIAAANAAVGNHYLVHDILHTQPVNPLVPGSAAGATQDMMNYGMTLAAMSQYAKNAGMTTSSGLVTAMMNDAADGVMDGRSGNGQVSVGGMMGGGVMQSDAGRVGLATAMADFMNSSLNKSGAASASMTSLMQQLRTSSGHMR